MLLVGYQASAFDISADILPVAKEVHVAAKNNRFGVKFEDVRFHDMVCIRQLCIQLLITILIGRLLYFVYLFCELQCGVYFYHYVIIFRCLYFIQVFVLV